MRINLIILINLLMLLGVTECYSQYSSFNKNQNINGQNFMSEQPYDFPQSNWGGSSNTSTIYTPFAAELPSKRSGISLFGWDDDDDEQDPIKPGGGDDNEGGFTDGDIPSGLTVFFFCIILYVFYYRRKLKRDSQKKTMS